MLAGRAPDHARGAVPYQGQSPSMAALALPAVHWPPHLSQSGTGRWRIQAWQEVVSQAPQVLSVAPRSTAVPKKDEGCLAQGCLTARGERLLNPTLPAQPYWHLVLPYGPEHPHALLRCRHKSEQSDAWKCHLVLPLHWSEPDLSQWDAGTTFLSLMTAHWHGLCPTPGTPA